MDTDAIGSAAAVEALKMSTAQNQLHSASKPAASPSPSGNSPPHKIQPTSKPPPRQEEEGSSCIDHAGGGVAEAAVIWRIKPEYRGGVFLFWVRRYQVGFINTTWTRKQSRYLPGSLVSSY